MLSVRDPNFSPVDRKAVAHQHGQIAVAVDPLYSDFKRIHGLSLNKEAFKRSIIDYVTIIDRSQVSSFQYQASKLFPVNPAEHFHEVKCRSGDTLHIRVDSHPAYVAEQGRRGKILKDQYYRLLPRYESRVKTGVGVST